MQDPAAANDGVEVAHPGMRRRQRCQPFCQRVVKRPGALFNVTGWITGPPRSARASSRQAASPS